MVELKPVALGLGLLPLALIFLVGLPLGLAKGREVYHRWPSSRTLQHLDQMLQDLGFGSAGPVMTELISGLAHAGVPFGLATFASPLTQWRWEASLFVLGIWCCFGVQRYRRYIERKLPRGVPSD